MPRKMDVEHLSEITPYFQILKAEKTVLFSYYSKDMDTKYPRQKSVCI